MTPQMDELSIRIQHGIQKAVAKALAAQEREEGNDGVQTPRNGSYESSKPNGHEH